MDSRQFFSPNSQINVTPYIDILLVLLIIFMVIQPVRQFDLEARVPDPPSAEPSPPSPGVFLSLDAESRIELNGESVQLADLGGRLFTSLSGRSDRTVSCGERKRTRSATWRE